jgi:hypothetical protein
MYAQQKNHTLTLVTLLGTVVSAITADASVISVGPGAFPASAAPITFSGLATGTEINGLSFGGVLFNYSLGSGAVVIDGGPGTTNNIAPPNIVSVGNAQGTLTLTLPGFADTFGYGYAVLNGAAANNATTINLFSGTANVGSLSYNGLPDPAFAGGFAGIQSTIPFDRVALSFNPAASAFAVDNIRFASTSVTAVPEPLTVLLMFSGVAGLWLAAKCVPSPSVPSRNQWSQSPSSSLRTR